MKTNFRVTGPLTSLYGNAKAPTSAEARGSVARLISSIRIMVIIRRVGECLHTKYFTGADVIRMALGE